MSAPTTIARLRLALAAAIALFLLAMSPGAALAQGDITDFKLERVASNPEFTFVPGAAAFATLVASPLGYPSAVGPVIGLGNDNCTTAVVLPFHVFPTGVVTPNTVADDCDAFLRAVDGRHEDSPGAFPGLRIEADFDPNGPAPDSVAIEPPPGQLGSPFSAHQCTLDVESNCVGLEPAFTLNTDDDQTEQDGAKEGNVSLTTKAGVCSTGCHGEVLNYDPRALDNPDERGAPAAQALVLCEGPPSAPIPGLPAFCAGNPLEALGVACGHPGRSCVVFAEAGPIDVVPDDRHEGDYRLHSTVDFTELEGDATGEQVTQIVINQFGLILQSPADPRQDPNPNDEQAALPLVFNPTTSITAISDATAHFADDSDDSDSFQTFPNPNDAAPDDNERAFIEEETEGYPWNNHEVDPENSTGGPTDATHDIVTRKQPENPPGVDPAQGDTPPAFDGNTEVNNFDKLNDSDTVPVETNAALDAQFTSPTRGGLEYQSHYKEISLDLKDTTLNGALAGRPGFKICTPDQFDRGAFESADCPEDAKIGDLDVLSPLADGDLGPVPCHTFAECSKVNPFVYADNGCFNAGVDPEDPCGNLEPRFNPADWAGGNPGANLDRIGGEVWAGPQVEGHPNQFRVFAQIVNSPTCEPNPPHTNPILCQVDGTVDENVEPRLHVKIEGVATADLETGEIHAVFDDLPELPVFDVTQSLDGGDFAVFTSPIECGDHKYTSEVVPFASLHGDGDIQTDSPPSAEPDDTITTVAAPNAPCGSNAAGVAARESAPTHGFAPQLSFLADPFTAAQDTSLTTSIKLEDRSDNLTKASVSLPDGLLGVLNSVPMCGRDLAVSGSCGADSQIGTVDVASGNGGHPIHIPGKVYFSQPGAAGELARITVVVPAKAGPFDLQKTIVNELAVRLRINGTNVGIDNVAVDTLPTIVSGIPVRIREINLTIDHPAFLRNPVTCNTLQGNGTFESAGGQSATATAPFTATGCEGLAFTPKLSATVGSADHPAKVGGHPDFTTVTTQPDHQAVIRKAVVTLPAGLFANTAVLSHLCTIAQASANACPPDTKVGQAKAVSPLVPNPLTGDAFIAENPSGGLPRLIMTLSNDLLAVPLEATTTLNGNRLVTTLDNLPAAPVTSFELTINGGPNGLFTVGNPLCTGATIDTTFTSHTGQTANDSSPVNLVGNCVPVPAPGAAAKPSLSVSVRRLSGAPLMTVRARSATGAAKLRTVRLVLPSKLAFNRAALKRGVAITAGSKRLKGSSWSLSRSGVLTVKAPKAGSSVITATIQSGALRSSKALKKLARSRSRKALPRLTFQGRVTDVKNALYGYKVRVRPVR